MSARISIVHPEIAVILRDVLGPDGLHDRLVRHVPRSGQEESPGPAAASRSSRRATTRDSAGARAVRPERLGPTPGHRDARPVGRPRHLGLARASQGYAIRRTPPDRLPARLRRRLVGQPDRIAGVCPPDGSPHHSSEASGPGETRGPERRPGCLPRDLHTVGRSADGSVRRRVPPDNRRGDCHRGHRGRDGYLAMGVGTGPIRASAVATGRGDRFAQGGNSNPGSRDQALTSCPAGACHRAGPRPCRWLTGPGW